MSDPERRYQGKRMVVRYNPRRCIHYAACVRGLPDVFDKDRRPWILPDNADADMLAEVVLRCPTGALHVEYLEEGTPEQPQAQSSAWIQTDGPIFLRGDITVQHEDGTPIVSDTRIALCRCGMSSNKPFCDGSQARGFHDDGKLAPQALAPAAEPGPLVVTVSAAGPYRLAGALSISSADRSQTELCGKAALCRCGGSQRKPFCDGSHRDVDQEIFT